MRKFRVPIAGAAMTQFRVREFRPTDVQACRILLDNGTDLVDLCTSEESL